MRSFPTPRPAAICDLWHLSATGYCFPVTPSCNVHIRYSAWTPFFGLSILFFVSVTVSCVSALVGTGSISTSHSVAKGRPQLRVVMAAEPVDRGCGPISAAKKVTLLIDDMIRSGKYKILFDALKSFRNGFVYGARIRAPHALVLNLVWSSAPYSVIARRVFDATRQHALRLGATAFTFSLLRSLMALVEGRQRPWHSVVAGFIIGCLYWGEQGAVTVQMSMYILSRILSALFFILMERLAVTTSVHPPPWAFRLYSGVLWMFVMPLFLYHREALQPTMRTSMQYIYEDCTRYSNWYNLLCFNSDTSF
ncbi:peroxisomal membrane protein 4, putative [Trypanosoma brucei gambiense DAL972]|uniref:Peroxisomal membrane protein 4, putative n=2 Tax=Trypanosoma brucei TaxID=5691 RepID=C9ZX28_TRYB9|nr:peroxisomal membrane protein 4, putative [Trypanosoma brucei gambiense DAL972]CBH13969.1 peroxisomal membrane protein 4, putative [Trypanosoma brucei gambiense DAL972]|eukprot:XP_011776243.1 peroxisomal membrane protein 4, putative [Trypanosoma brucei gambiense DAL972]